MSITKRWPKRREFLAYYMLLRYTDSKGIDIIDAGTAIDILYVITGSKRLAYRLLRMLVRQRFLERILPLKYRVRGLDEILEEALGYYIAGRIRRRGIASIYNSVEKSIAIEDIELCKKIRNMIEELGYRVKCGS